MAKHPFLIKDGKKLAVMRPEDPRMAIDMAFRVQALSEGGMPYEKTEQLFNEILNSQPYTYMGLLSRDQRILDTRGWAIGKVLPGDSFIDFEDAKKWIELSRDMAPQIKELEAMVDAMFVEAWRSKVRRSRSAATTVWREIVDGDLKVIVSADTRIGIIMSAKTSTADGSPTPCEDERVFAYVTPPRDVWEPMPEMRGYWKLRPPPSIEPAAQG